MRRRDGGGGGKRNKRPSHASSQPTTSANNAKPQVSRIRDIDEQLEDMLRSADGEYKPDKKTAGGVEGSLTNIEKMNRLANAIAVQGKRQE